MTAHHAYVWHMIRDRWGEFIGHVAFCDSPSDFASQEVGGQAIPWHVFGFG